MKKTLLLLALPWLAACGFKPEEVPFATHPSVLRGVWVGTLESGPHAGKTLTLTFTPTFVPGGATYDYTATGTLGSVAVTASGTASGGSYYKYMQAQTSPMPTSTHLTLLLNSGQKDDLFCRYVPLPQWSCTDDFGLMTLKPSSAATGP